MHWPKSPRAQALLSVVAGMPFAAALLWERTYPKISESAADFVIGVCFSLWIYILIQTTHEDVSHAYAEITKKVAGFSYTLYLVHFPALLLLRGILDPSGNWQPNLVHLIYGLAITFLMLAYAYLVAELTEARTGPVRRRILQPWGSPPKESAR